MAVFRPFQALRYNPALIPDLSAVVAPPYDVIDAAQRDRLYAREPRNVVRLILNRSADPYADAATNLEAWRQQDVLVRTPRPLMGYHRERFTLPDGSTRERTGLIGVARLEPFATGIIRPHERTFARAKEDRLALIRACRTNLSPIFGLYADRPEVLAAVRTHIGNRSPDIDLTDPMGVSHAVWLLTDNATLTEISAALANETLFIADGHHRYETALAYCDACMAEGGHDPHAAHNFVLMYLTSTSDPGLVVLPTHRVLTGPQRLAPEEVVARLRRHFEVETVSAATPNVFWKRLRERPHGRFGVALAGSEALFLATLVDPSALAGYVADLAPVVRALDVAVLDRAVLRGLMAIDCTAAVQAGELTYTHDDAAALTAVRDGASAAFLMNAPHIDDVVAVCRAGETMPEKSTYFFPKLLTGLLFHTLDD